MIYTKLLFFVAKMGDFASLNFLNFFIKKIFFFSQLCGEKFKKKFTNRCSQFLKINK
jgi:hypothetical protein